MSCNLNKPDTQTEFLITQLKREMESIKKNETARYLEQTGKIAELCNFVKDNLTNELRMLFDSMQMSGELDKIIKSTVLSQIDYIEQIVHPIGHIARYGGVGDGVTDDTQALKKAVANAQEYNEPLVVGEGKYYITADIDATGIKEIQIDGEIINTDCVLHVGGSSTDGTGLKVNIRKINNLMVTGAKNSVFDIGYCDRLTLYANGDIPDIASIAYCQFYGAYCKEIVFESRADATEIGWINENVFRIKRVEHVSMSGNYPHNNNFFEHVNLEKGILDLNNCRNNYFSARCEGGITINSNEGTQANFVEKEHYYRHYFGDDVIEDTNGVVSFFPVTKLQTERQLLKIDQYNKHFPVGTLTFNEEGRFMGGNYQEIYHSNLIPINNTFTLKLKSDGANFRAQMRFYDENKNQIKTEVDNFADGRMKYNGADANWTYSVSANVAVDSVNFFPGKAKYVEYSVIFGTANTLEIEYVTVKLVKYTNTDINISNTLKNDVYTQVPTTGYWERGTILYGKSPIAGAGIGIVCVESGTPGVWKNWGTVSN